MSRFQTYYYKPKPGATPAPASSRFPKGPVGQRVRPEGPRLSMRSKKGYTGTRAGLGRVKAPSPATGPIYRQGPQGPAAARFPSIRLPQRTAAGAPSATRQRPGLINRIVSRLRGRAAL